MASTYRRVSSPRSVAPGSARKTEVRVAAGTLAATLAALTIMVHESGQWAMRWLDLMLQFVPINYVNDMIKAMIAAVLSRWEGRNLGRALYWANAFDKAETECTDAGEGMFLLNPYFPHDPGAGTSTPPEVPENEIHIERQLFPSDDEMV